MIRLSLFQIFSYYNGKNAIIISKLLNVKIVDHHLLISIVIINLVYYQSFKEVCEFLESCGNSPEAAVSSRVEPLQTVGET